MKKELSLVKLSENDLKEVKAGVVAGCVMAGAAAAAPGACLCLACLSCPRLQGPCCVIYNPVGEVEA